MDIGNYNISVGGTKYSYQCKVKEVHENAETFYHVAILLPVSDLRERPVSQREYNIDLHFDCETGALKVKEDEGGFPTELLDIETKLSDLICGIHD